MDQQAPLYDRDFFEWTQREAAKLRAGQAARVNLDLDFENLAEEVESMGRGQLRALESALARVVEHLLKLEFSPSEQPRRLWGVSVRIHRQNAQGELDQSPSLHRRARLSVVYRSAILLVEESFIQHGEAVPEFPVECPYTLDQILDDGFLPANRHGLTDR